MCLDFPIYKMVTILYFMTARIDTFAFLILLEGDRRQPNSYTIASHVITWLLLN